MSNLWFSMKTRLMVDKGPQKMRSGTALRGSKQRSGVEDGVVVRTLCVRKREVHKLSDNSTVASLLSTQHICFCTAALCMCATFCSVVVSCIATGSTTSATTSDTNETRPTSAATVNVTTAPWTNQTAANGSNISSRAKLYRLLA